MTSSCLSDESLRRLLRGELTDVEAGQVVWADRFEGQLTVFKPFDGPCYRCLFPQPPPPELAPSCAEGGVLGVLPGIMGSLQAAEALKLLLGIGDSMSGRLLLFDALELSFQEVRLRRDPGCPVCGEHAGPIEYIDYEQFCLPPARAAGDPV